MLAAFVSGMEESDMAVDKKAAGLAAGANPAEAPFPPERYAWYVVLVLMVVYIFSFIDRQILGLLVDLIKKDLKITDEYIGYLYGTTFAIFYTLFGIPLGRMADSRSRRGLVAVGLFLWSLMSAGCGLAKNFTQLVVFRVGVGVGEATLSPSAYSMIADYFRPSRMALAISVYGAGIYIGSGMASVVGGLVVQWAMERPPYEFAIIGTVRPWQLVFFVIGLPGMLFTLIMLTVKEPERRGLHKKTGQEQTKGLPFREVAGYIGANWKTFFCHTVGFSFMSFVGYAGAAWIPAVFMRVHHWSPREIGVRYGVAVMILGTAGIIFGGKLAEWFAKKGYKDSNMRAGLIGAAFNLPFTLAYPLISDPWLAFLVLLPAIFAVGMPFGVAPAAIQEMMPNQMRGQAAAVYLFVVNLIGIGLGPSTVGSLTTRVFGVEKVNYSLLVANGTANVLSIVLLLLGLAFFRRSLDHRDQWHKANT
jgi:MFS family permease